MMNKRALFGAIIGAIFLLIILALGILYFQLKNSGLTIKTGNIVIDISYNDSENVENNTPDANNSLNSEEIINTTEPTITEENNSISNQTQ